MDPIDMTATATYRKHKYLFPDEELPGMTNDALRGVISSNLDQANDQTDGTDMYSDVKIDYAQ